MVEPYVMPGEPYHGQDGFGEAQHTVDVDMVQVGSSRIAMQPCNSLVTRTWLRRRWSKGNTRSTR